MSYSQEPPMFFYSPKPSRYVHDATEQANVNWLLKANSQGSSCPSTLMYMERGESLKYPFQRKKKLEIEGESTKKE